MPDIRTRFTPARPAASTSAASGRRTSLAIRAPSRRALVLRIEDTDIERSTTTATRAIVDELEWLGLDHDEGPYYQMQRMDRYRAVLADMLARGLAYRCYMPQAELDALREAPARRRARSRATTAVGVRSACRG